MRIIGDILCFYRNITISQNMKKMTPRKLSILISSSEIIKMSLKSDKCIHVYVVNCDALAQEFIMQKSTY